MEETETPRRSYVVWYVAGDVMGRADVYRRGAWWTVETQPFYTADPWGKKGFRSQEAAYRYASECASEYQTQAMEDERVTHEQEGCCAEIDMDEMREAYWTRVYDHEEGRELQDWEL